MPVGLPKYEAGVQQEADNHADDPGDRVCDGIAEAEENAQAIDRKTDAGIETARDDKSHELGIFSGALGAHQRGKAVFQLPPYARTYISAHRMGIHRSTDA